MRVLHPTGRVRRTPLQRALSCSDLACRRRSRGGRGRLEVLFQHPHQQLHLLARRQLPAGLTHPRRQQRHVLSRLQQLGLQHRRLGTVVHLAVHVPFPQPIPERRPLQPRVLGQFPQRQPHRLPHAVQGAELGHQPQHMGGIQPLLATFGHQPRLHQAVQHRVERQLRLFVFQQPLAEVNQRRGMEAARLGIQLQGQLPAQVVFDQLRRLGIAHPLHELQNAHPQQDYRLQGRAAVVAAVAGGQLPTGGGQQRIDPLGKEAETVLGPEARAQQALDAEQTLLGGEVG